MNEMSKAYVPGTPHDEGVFLGSLATNREKTARSRALTTNAA